MTRDDIAKERALKMHDLALSVLRVKGTVKLDGLASGLEFRGPLLNIEWRRNSLIFGPAAVCYRWNGSVASRRSSITFPDLGNCI